MKTKNKPKQRQGFLLLFLFRVGGGLIEDFYICIFTLKECSRQCASQFRGHNRRCPERK
jgi:hypothetical protein